MRSIVASLLLLAACRVDPIDSLPSEETPIPPPEIGFTLLADAEENRPEIERIEAELRRHLGVLGGPYVEGRRPGTQGARQAVSYLLSELTTMHVLPAAPAGGWVQPVPLRVVTSEGSLRLPAAQSPLPGVRLAYVGKDGTHGANARTLDIGLGITAPEWEHDDYADVGVNDRIVFISAGVPEKRDTTSAYGTIEYKVERARRAGAAAAILMTGLPESEPAWADAVTAFTLPYVQPLGPADRIPPTIPYGIASLEAEGLLADLLPAATDGGPQPENAALSLSVETTSTFTSDPNVIGRFVGIDLPEQSVIISAHWDAGGHRPPAAQGAGAEDNAAGVAMALAVADRVAQWVEMGRQPRRSIVFVFTAAGSLDDLGIREFIQDGIMINDNVAAAIVLNGFELDAPDARLVSIGAERSSLSNTLNQIFADRLASRPAGDEHDTRARAAFDDAGIVAVTVTRRSPTARISDHAFDPATDLRGMAEATDAIFELAWTLADAPDVPVRIEAPED